MVKREKIKRNEEERDDTSAFLDKYKEMLQIDRHALDDEWVSQPQHYQAIGERLAMEISYRDQAKDALKDIEAEVDAEIREEDEARLASADKEDKAKRMTETAIKNAVRTDERLADAKRNLIRMDRNATLLQNLQGSWHQRRYALDNLVTLHVSGYAMRTSSKAEEAKDRSHMEVRRKMHKARKGEDE